VAQEGPQRGQVRVGGGTHPREGPIVPVLIAIELLPAARRVDGQRILDVDDGETPEFRRQEARTTRGQGRFQKIASVHVDHPQVRADYSRRRSCQIETSFWPLRSRAAPSQMAKAMDRLSPRASLRPPFGRTAGGRRGTTVARPSCDLALALASCETRGRTVRLAMPLAPSLVPVKVCEGSERKLPSARAVMYSRGWRSGACSRGPGPACS